VEKKNGGFALDLKSWPLMFSTTKNSEDASKTLLQNQKIFQAASVGARPSIKCSKWEERTLVLRGNSHLNLKGYFREILMAFFYFIV
jgi:hypothetical protein